MPINNEAHTILVSQALEALAIRGISVWSTNTGALPTKSGGFIKFGKKGGADITGILAPHGRHLECEAKTGNGVQNKNQKIHQKYVVEENGGLYIIFHSVEELLEKLKDYLIV